ncbi:MAG: cyclase family protein [Planctomycetes bacterium]|nr:cyclase family protein [Planctomycetota bacterium]
MDKSSTIYDITPVITPDIGVWPGDTPLAREVLCDMQRGDNITLSTIHTTVHLGAHADGPNHFGKDAPAIHERSLEYYIGPCQVVHVDAIPGTRVSIDLVKAGFASMGIDDTAAIAPRILIATGTFPDHRNWNNDFSGLEPSLVDWLNERGVITIGTDAPSVDPMTSKDLPAHAAFLRNDMAILEGLVLRDVQSGMYELIALPLPLVGFDASPVRAILRKL